MNLLGIGMAWRESMGVAIEIGNRARCAPDG